MKFKRVIIVLLTLLLTMPLLSGEPKVKLGGLIYTYAFFHSNTDFDKDTKDGNSYLYIHADIQTTVDFGKGVTFYTMLGAWSQHGANPYWGVDLQGYPDPSLRILQGYIEVKNLGDSPISLTIGKKRLLYGDGAVLFDGGEDGATGVWVNYSKGKVNADIFYIRLAQSHGIAYVGAPFYGGYNPEAYDGYPGNINIIGIYSNVNFSKAFKLQPYVIYRPWNIEAGHSASPVWIGARAEGEIKGLSYALEYTQMSGDDGYGVSYKGYEFLTKADYAFSSKFSLGGAYVSFSGDDDPTDGKNYLYESATNGPYTFGFYKDWPGFGPAHLMTTGYGFAGLDPGNTTMTNLDTVNFHLTFTAGAFTLRGDFFIYSRNKVPAGGHKAMGNEIALLVKYNYRDKITFGLTGGAWAPGDYFKKDLGLEGRAATAYGGYFWTALAF